MDNFQQKENKERLIQFFGTEAWHIFQGEAGKEIADLVLGLRNNLDPRIAGRIDGIEWVIETLPQLIKEEN